MKNTNTEAKTTRKNRNTKAKAKVEDKAPEQEDEEQPKRRMSETLRRYAVGYEPSLSYSGRKSKVSGDDLSHLLAGLEPRAVVELAERVLDLPKGELWSKYEKLNKGQQRMNAGNRIRAAIKRGDLTEEQVKLRLVK